MGTFLWIKYNTHQKHPHSLLVTLLGAGYHQFVSVLNPYAAKVKD